MPASTPTRFRLPGFRTLFALLFFALIGGFLLSTEHRAHAIGVLPFLFILALCPLMHIFMHGGHGAHGSPGADDGDRTAGPDGGNVTGTHRH